MLPGAHFGRSSHRTYKQLVSVILLFVLCLPAQSQAQNSVNQRGRGSFKRIGNFFRKLLSSSPGCPEGQYNETSSGNCSACPMGSWAPPQSEGLSSCLCDLGYEGPGGAHCVACAAGKYKNSTGSSANCTDCPSWSFSSEEASTEIGNCTCNAGYEGFAQDTCSPCPPGSYKEGRGEGPCLPCPANSYSSGWASDSCTACPSNTIAAIGSQALGNCSCIPGYYGLADAGGCQKCPQNTYSGQVGLTEASGCLDCPADSYSLFSAESMRGACKCAAGFYGNLSDPSQNCSSCANGTYNGKTGQPDPRACVPCRANSTSLMASTSADNCSCFVGFYLSSDVCVLCEPGKYNDEIGQLFCKNCSLGGDSLGAHSPAGSDELEDCICGQGHYLSGSCQVCEVGTYQPEVGQTEVSSCLPCTSNSTSPEASVSLAACSCLAGFYGFPGDGGNCTSCPANSNSDPRSPFAINCTCNFGYTGMHGQPCEACVPGTFKPNAGSAACSDCSAGTYSMAAAATSVSQCTSCPQNTQSGTASSNCSCDRGYTLVNATDFQCAACVAGSFKETIGGDECNLCDSGKYSTGLAQVHNSSCQDCPANSHSVAGTSNLSGCICRPGHYGPDGDTCSACEAGKYKSSNGSLPCDLCMNISSPPLDEYTSAEASVEQTACRCNAGYTGENGGLCIPCAAGEYKEAIGNSSCSNCSALRVSVAGSRTSQDCLCLPGYTGASCTACEAGTYKSTRGPDPCDLCDTNNAASGSSAVGSTDVSDCICGEGFVGANGTCTPCDVGSYKVGTGPGECQNCTKCPAGFWSNCTRIADGLCSPCTSTVANSYFNDSGRVTTAVADWKTGVACTDTLAPPYPYPLVRTLSSTCQESWQSDSCPFLCTAGFYAANGNCEACSTARCPQGQYRDNCTGLADGRCVACSNAIPSNSYYSSSGDPYNTDNCGYSCNAGYFDTGSSTCSPCTNTIPANAFYSGNGTVVGTNGAASCAWDCNLTAGFYADGMECKTTDEQCPRGKCPFPQVVVSDKGARLEQACFEWEYAVCFQNGSYTCQPCEGMVERFQGGWFYRTYTSCPVGQYRAPCNNRCVFPDAGNMRGQCINCTNAASAEPSVNYTSAGGSASQPYGNNNCEWECSPPSFSKGLDAWGNTVCAL